MCIRDRYNTVCHTGETLKDGEVLLYTQNKELKGQTSMQMQIGTAVNDYQIASYLSLIHILFVSDDIRGCVGTINLDFRSLYLHFECGAYMYSNCLLYTSHIFPPFRPSWKNISLTEKSM